MGACWALASEGARVAAQVGVSSCAATRQNKTAVRSQWAVVNGVQLSIMDLNGWRVKLGCPNPNQTKNLQCCQGRLLNINSRGVQMNCFVNQSLKRCAHYNIV